VLPAERHGSLEVGQRRGRAGRVVGIIEPHEPRPAGNRFRDGIEVRQPMVAGPQRHQVHFGARQRDAGRVGGIPRIRRQGNVPRVQPGHGQVRDALLGPDERQDLAGRVERNRESLPVVTHDLGAQRRRARVTCVTVLAGIARRCAQRFDDRLRRRSIRAADVQSNDVYAAGPQAGDLLVERRKDIGRRGC